MRYIAIILGLSSGLLIGCASDEAYMAHSQYIRVVKDAPPGSTYEQVVYVWAKGDSVASVCRRFHIYVADLESMNPDLQASHLSVGQKVIVYERLK
jgi:hypothetical protein